MAANLFPDYRKRNSCPLLSERVCEVILHLAEHKLVVGVFPYMLYKIKIRGRGLGQSIHYILLTLNVLIDHPCLVQTDVQKHKVPAHRTRIRVHKCLSDRISIVAVGHISVYDGIHVSRTGHPALASYDAPRNILCFWAQLSENNILQCSQNQ